MSSSPSVPSRRLCSGPSRADTVSSSASCRLCSSRTNRVSCSTSEMGWASGGRPLGSGRRLVRRTMVEAPERRGDRMVADWAVKWVMMAGSGGWDAGR